MTGWRRLDREGAGGWDHRSIVEYLQRHHPEVSAWWQQWIAVEYERARGKRAVGETAATGFQVGVQRTVPLPVREAWQLIASRPELWLGEGGSVPLEVGQRYQVAGATGEIRVVKPGDRLRLTWQQEGWRRPATVQLTLSPSPSGRTAIHAHVEKLPDAEVRQWMRHRWRAALERVAVAAGSQ